MRKKNDIPVYDLTKAARAGLHVRVVDHQTIDEEREHDVVSAHRDNSYLLFLMKTGYGRFLVDFEEYVFSGPALCLIRPEQVHSVINYQQTEGWLVTFDPGLLAPELVESAQLLTGPFGFEADQLRSIYELTHLLHGFFQSENTQPLTLKTLLNGLISAICDLCQRTKIIPGQPENRADEIAVAFRKLVEANFTRWKQPSQYAEALHLSVNHLTDTIKQKTGFPVSYWIQHQTMLEARRLLFHTQSPVKDVAYQLGFSDQHYFSRLFRKFTGYTPVAFRQSFHDLSTKALL